jgi:hypothetical protein
MKSITLFILGCALGVAIAPTNAHTPCDRQECGWETVVHPITAEITQEYICK